jgi:hypothetical protein
MLRRWQPPRWLLLPRRTTPPPSKPLLAVLCARRARCRDCPTGVTEPGVLDVVPLSVATGNVRVYFTALSFSRRVVVTLKQWPLPCEARQMVINLRGRSADASRIVWARVADLRRNSYSVRYSLLVRRRHSVKIMWQSLEFRPDTK